MVTTVTNNSPQAINTSLFSLEREMNKNIEDVSKVANKTAKAIEKINTEGTVVSVNNKQGIVTLTASDVGALPDTTTIPSKTSQLTNDSGFITSSSLSAYVPTSRTVNGKALSSNISLTASDVGALPDTTVIPTKTSQLTNDSNFATTSDVSTAETNAKNLANATGTLTIAHGGTGATTAIAAEYNLIGGVETVETEPTDDRYIALRNMTVSNTNGSFRWTKCSSVWNWIKSKIGTVFGLTATKTDNAIARWDGTAGKLQNSGVTVDDSDNVSTPGTVTSTGIRFPKLTGTNGRSLIEQTVGTSDAFRIYTGATAENAGFAEIATGDDGIEPIYVRQYKYSGSGSSSVSFGTIQKSATLLDSSGNTLFPGTVTATGGFSGNVTGTATGLARTTSYTLTVTPGTWTTIADKTRFSNSGIYVFDVEVNDDATWWSEHLSFLLYFYLGVDNSSATSTINFNQSGHAPNTGTAQLRVKRNTQTSDLRNTIDLYLSAGKSTGVTVTVNAYRLA